MERLTERHAGVAVIKDKSRQKDAMEVLARYEETGLTPEEIMGQALENYDPNITVGIHTVRVTIQQWGYIGHIILKIHGNMKGLGILNYFDFEESEGDEENDCNLTWVEDVDYFKAVLKDKDGNTLGVDGDYRDFNNMIVGIEIINHQPEQTKERDKNE